jgi:hypothetical protein
MTEFSLDCFTSSEKIHVFHYCMFHGMALGAELEDNLHFLGGEDRRPLQLVRNVWRIPDAFMPTNNVSLVVSELVKSKLSSLPNIEFREVQFTKKIRFPYEAGDFSFYESAIFSEGEGIADDPDFLDRFPELAESEPVLGHYYEVIVARHIDIVRHFTDLVNVRCNPSEFQGEFDLELSAELAEQYPIFRDRCHFLNPTAFEILSEHIDWNYFEATKIDF